MPMRATGICAWENDLVIVVITAGNTVHEAESNETEQKYRETGVQDLVPEPGEGPLAASWRRFGNGRLLKLRQRQERAAQTEGGDAVYRLPGPGGDERAGRNGGAGQDGLGRFEPGVQPQIVLLPMVLFEKLIKQRVVAAAAECIAHTLQKAQGDQRRRLLQCHHQNAMEQQKQCSDLKGTGFSQLVANRTGGDFQQEHGELHQYLVEAHLGNTQPLVGQIQHENTA